VLDCQPGVPVDPDDGVGCTVDSCDEGTDLVVNTPDDASCDDADPCTADSCDEIQGCAHDPIPECSVAVPTGGDGAHFLVAFLLVATAFAMRQSGPNRRRATDTPAATTAADCPAGDRSARRTSP
jgi:hypothetical protein